MLLSKNDSGIQFRSGCKNEPEMVGYSAANQAWGTSLAHFKSPNNIIYQYMVDALKVDTKVFLDNGLITAFNKGKGLDNNAAMKRYIKIVGDLKKTKNLSIVVPDSPLDCEEALSIVKQFKLEIKTLSKKCRVILPIHKTDPNIRSIKEQGLLIGKELNWTKITLGIPCKGDWRLTLNEIEELFIN